MDEYLIFDSPIYNLQVFLRMISRKYKNIPIIIPDGAYGSTTKSAVSAFQENFSLNSNGITDNSTWDSILSVYRDVEKDYALPHSARVFPEAGLNADYGSYTPTIYVIQSMLLALSQYFSNVPAPSISGVLDASTIESVKAIQISGGLNPDGNISKSFWNFLSAIYETFISANRVEFIE